MRNALTKVGAKERKEAGRDLKAIFTSPDKALCLATAEEMALKWETRKPALAKQIRAQAEECLSVHHLASNARRRLSSTNMVERVNREIKRRTNVVGIFPNTESCDRLIGRTFWSVTRRGVARRSATSRQRKIRIILH